MRVRLFSKKPISIEGVKEKRDRGGSEKRIRIIADHKADARYPIVSAASIMAKVTRDEEIERIGEKTGIKIGSGYPSDRYTMDAIKENLGSQALRPYIRDYWKTMRLVRQLKIEDFLA